jgi:hypothetical protein
MNMLNNIRQMLMSGKDPLQVTLVTRLEELNQISVYRICCVNYTICCLFMLSV